MQSTRLPDSWVKLLLDRMSAMYGEKFVRQWEKTDPDVMRNLWAESLGCFAGEQIKWALLHLAANNPYPPTLPEFVILCKQAPRPQPPALPAPSIDYDEVAPYIAEAAKQVAAPREDMLGWATKPPATQYRGPWEQNIMWCVEKGDERFRGILRAHVDSGVITNKRALALLRGEHAAADA